MSDDDENIEGGALRIMRAYPTLYGRGPWSKHGKLLAFGFLCGPGWYPLLERLSSDLSQIVREDALKNFRVVQVKEKFGELRFYAKHGNERTGARIASAEQEASSTCEHCGASGKLRDNGRAYLVTLCDACSAKYL